MSTPRTYSHPARAKGYAAWLLVLPIYLSLWAFARVFKRVPAWLLQKLLRDHKRETMIRAMDMRIPTNPDIPAYMCRWWKIKRNAFFNCYYHIVRRSDDDTALHDHPWWNFSIVLDGGYYEHRILEGGVQTKIWYGPGSVLFRRAGNYAHRLELARDLDKYRDDVGELPTRSIFITGPTLRRWGFHHTERWVDAYEWDEFLAERGHNLDRMAGYAEQNAKGAN